jgi:hypothetical protein
MRNKGVRKVVANDIYLSVTNYWAAVSGKEI